MCRSDTDSSGNVYRSPTKLWALR